MLERGFWGNIILVRGRGRFGRGRRGLFVRLSGEASFSEQTIWVLWGKDFLGIGFVDMWAGRKVREKRYSRFRRSFRRKSRAE